MATNKNRINAYVDDSAYEAFKAWCERWDCSHSKGIELLIKQCLGEGGVPGNAPMPSVSSVPDNVPTRKELERAIASLRSEIQPLLKAHREQKALAKS
jgi:antitoxin component of RelBE/YafQ-DinJ toxin-antitoxin module